LDFFGRGNRSVLVNTLILVVLALFLAAQYFVDEFCLDVGVVDLFYDYLVNGLVILNRCYAF